MTDLDSIFHYAYITFIEQGGFALPCRAEAVERAYRQTIRRRPDICPHGKTYLTCADCYIAEGGWKRGAADGQ